ncbi:MAG: response regulator [Acidobacteriota bacterium]
MEKSESKILPAVLLVDDEELYLRAMVRDFRQHGYAVTARRDTVSGEQAYRELRRQGQRPLVIVDLVQPGSDGGYLGGLDLLRRLGPDPECEIIAVSDNEAAWLATSARSLGAKRTIVKPDLRRVEPEHIDSAVQEFLDEISGRESSSATPTEAPLREPGAGSGGSAPGDLLGALEELRHAADRSSVLLLVMRYAAEITARGLLYEVEGDHLRVLGRFGMDGGAHGDEVIGLDEDTLPGRAFWSGRLQRSTGSEVAALAPGLPEPAPGEGVALPVMGPGGVAAVLYADTGAGAAGLPDLRSLSALAATASLALGRSVRRPVAARAV